MNQADKSPSQHKAFLLSEAMFLKCGVYRAGGSADLELWRLNFGGRPDRPLLGSVVASWGLGTGTSCRGSRDEQNLLNIS